MDHQGEQQLLQAVKDIAQHLQQIALAMQQIKQDVHFIAEAQVRAHPAPSPPKTAQGMGR